MPRRPLRAAPPYDWPTERSARTKTRICPRHVLCKTSMTKKNDRRCKSSRTYIPTAGQDKTAPPKTAPPIHRCHIWHHKTAARTSADDTTRNCPSTGIGTPINKNNTRRWKTPPSCNGTWPTATNTTKTSYFLRRRARHGEIF